MTRVRPARGEPGTAIVEFVWLAVLLMLPLLYVVLAVFIFMGAMVGLAAALNATRFSIVPSNAGMGLELKAIAAVVVGGTAITGGRGTLVGTLIGVALLGTIGTALTFAGINPFWEKSIQGAIIIVALVSEVAMRFIRVPLTLQVER